MSELRYLGHSAFYIKSGSFGVLIDPFLTGNPKANFDWKTEKITHIFVTHAHMDHLGDAIPISIATGAKIYAVFELANYCSSKGAKAVGVGIGAEIETEWGSFRFVPAVHTSSNPELPYGGLAAGVILNIDNTSIYHAGDTSLTSEMQLIRELYQPYYSLLPVGGYYTMGIKEAVEAAKILYSMEIIPMHYNTFPQIQVNINEFKELIEAQGQTCSVLGINESINFE